jgi:tetratricopeptide (TPR) repeat protein
VKGFEKLPPKVPDTLSWAYNSFGLMLFQQAKYDEAIHYQQKAVELNPLDDQAYYNLALSYIKAGRQDEVIAVREKLNSMGSKLADSLNQQLPNREKKNLTH